MGLAQRQMLSLLTEIETKAAAAVKVAAMEVNEARDASRAARDELQAMRAQGWVPKPDSELRKEQRIFALNQENAELRCQLADAHDQLLRAQEGADGA